MFTKINYTLYLIIIVTTENMSNSVAEKSANVDYKYLEAVSIASSVLKNIIIMFDKCVSRSMPNQQFLTNNIQNFINYPSKTTIGFAPKFTNNRRFFANLISTAAFKDMVSKDEEKLRNDFIRKLKYCDENIMDQNILFDFYQREVDQTKM